MRLTFFFRWYDLWVGAYWDRTLKALYVCPLPTLGIKIQFGLSEFERAFKQAAEDMER